MGFERLDVEQIWEGKIITVGQERFRHDDGSEVTREKVWHPEIEEPEVAIPHFAKVIREYLRASG